MGPCTLFKLLIGRRVLIKSPKWILQIKFFCLNFRKFSYTFEYWFCLMPSLIIRSLFFWSVELTYVGLRWWRLSRLEQISIAFPSVILTVSSCFLQKDFTYYVYLAQQGVSFPAKQESVENGKWSGLAWFVLISSWVVCKLRKISFGLIKWSLLVILP